MKYFKPYILLAIILVITFSLIGCSVNAPQEEPQISEETEKQEEANQEPEPQPEEPSVDPASVNANEAGQIMILEWHVIGEKEDRWARTYTNFRKDLETLYEKGYRLVSLRDVVTNNIKVEAGYTPVVLTFDDGTAGHFRYIEQGGKRIIDPNCAVGILKAFAEEHPDFGLEATFYINYYTPFGQKDSWQDKLREIVAMGMDLGNHTVNHHKLNTLSKEKVEEELGKMVEMVQEVVSGYELDTLALPHGINPKDVNWAVSGEYNGIKYHNKAILLVGSGPIKSPVVKGFDPTKLPRIQVFQEEFDKWLNYFDNNPDKRYISDGDPDTISIPADQQDKIDESLLGDKKLYIYN
ncbi:MAG: polysaccharide deacetylase family protein [Clostridia bacterium]|nr:polysaccharide deacetylase family protein [Clostridia bacterium]